MTMSESQCSIRVEWQQHNGDYLGERTNNGDRLAKLVF